MFKKSILLTLTGVICVVLLTFGVWSLKAHELKKAAVSFLHDMTPESQGVHIAYDRIETFGFPFKVGLRIINPQISSPSLNGQTILSKSKGYYALSYAFLSGDLVASSRISAYEMTSPFSAPVSFQSEGQEQTCRMTLTGAGRKLLWDHLFERDKKEPFLFGPTVPLSDWFPLSSLACETGPVVTKETTTGNVVSDVSKGLFHLSTKVLEKKISVEGKLALDYRHFSSRGLTSFPLPQPILEAYFAGLGIAPEGQLAFSFKGEYATLQDSLSLTSLLGPLLGKASFQLSEFSYKNPWYHSVLGPFELSFERDATQSQGHLHLATEFQAFPAYDAAREQAFSSLDRLKKEDFSSFLFGKTQKEKDNFYSLASLRSLLKVDFITSPTQFGRLKKEINLSLRETSQGKQMVSLKKIFLGNEATSLSVDGELTRSLGDATPVGHVHFLCHTCSTFVSAIVGGIRDLLEAFVRVETPPFMAGISSEQISFYAQMLDSVLVSAVENALLLIGKKVNTEDLSIVLTLPEKGEASLSGRPLSEVLKTFEGMLSSLFSVSSHPTTSAPFTGKTEGESPSSQKQTPSLPSGGAPVPVEGSTRPHTQTP